jgi:hypothetical protein
MYSDRTYELMGLVIGCSLAVLGCGDDTRSSSRSDGSDELAADEIALTKLELLGKRLYGDTQRQVTP